MFPTFQIYGMQASAPCRIVEMTAEVLGLEYEFKVVLEYMCVYTVNKTGFCCRWWTCRRGTT